MTCLCKPVWREAQGSHDTVTGEWLPDQPTLLVSLDHNSECPMHPWYYLQIRIVRLVEDLGNGWARFEHEDGKIWTHWANQIRSTPFGPPIF